jgi:hypothetical protein
LTTYVLLKWAHIIAMVYWLGGEWGVFQTAYHVTNTKLSLEERRRHLETAYRIDILARTGIVLLFPLGFHMGAAVYNAHPWGDYVPHVWVIMLSWLALTWAAFIKRESDTGLMLTRIDERLRYVFIPLLFTVSLWSLVGDGPLTVTWYAAKVFIYSLLLIIGLGLRFIMRHWTTIFRRMEVEGNTPELVGQLAREIAMSRVMAYCYWIGIGSVAMFGVAKVPY